MDKTYIVNCPVEGEATVVEFDAASPNKQLCDLIKTSTVRRGKKQPFFCRGFDYLMLWEDDRHFDKRYSYGKPLLYNRKAEEFLTMKEMGNVVFSHVGKDGLPDGMPEDKAKAIASLLNIDPKAEREAMIKADNAAADAEGEITEAVRQKWFRNYGTCNDWDNERARLFRIASILHDRDMKAHPELHKVHRVDTIRGWHETSCTCGYKHSCDSSD